MLKHELIKPAGYGIATLIGSMALFMGIGEITGENKQLEPVISPGEEVPLNTDEAALADSHALEQDVRVLEVVAPEMIDTVEVTDRSVSVKTGLYIGVVSGLGVGLVVGMNNSERKREAARCKAYHRKIDEMNRTNPINSYLARMEIEEVNDHRDKLVH